MPTHFPTPDASAQHAGMPGGAPAPKPRRRGVPVWLFILLLIAGIAGGVFAGRYLLTPTMGYLSGKTSLTEAELDDVVGSYDAGGNRHEITAREALEITSSLESLANEDGTYPVPSAENVVNVARNQILAAAVESEGIEVSDADVEAYAQQMFGSTDYATLAQSYGMTAEQFEQMVRESTAVQALYKQVVGDDTATADLPQMPTAPAEGAEDEATAEYGAYVTGLLGDAWNGEENTWANTDNPYYEVLGDEVFSADSATYGQAMEAYYVAYGQSNVDTTSSMSAWTEYVNGLMANASITIGELVS